MKICGTIQLEELMFHKGRERNTLCLVKARKIHLKCVSFTNPLELESPFGEERSLQLNP